MSQAYYDLVDNLGECFGRSVKGGVEEEDDE